MSPIPPAGLCCEAGGGGFYGIGARVQYDGTTRGTLDGDGIIQPMLVAPTELSAVIANPYTHDLWIEGAVDLGTWALVTLGYTGRLATFSRALTSGPATINVPYASFTSGRDGAGSDATPSAGEFPINAGIIEFGFLVGAGLSETVAVTIGISIADDGTLGNYQIVPLQRPAITYSGVPIATP